MRLNKTERNVFGLIWMMDKLSIKTSVLSKLLKIKMYDLRKALNKLHEKRWISKKNRGRNGLELSLRKKVIPRYVIRDTENNLSLYSRIETKMEKYCTK